MTAMKRIFLITTALLSAAIIYSQESYTFRFQESDFTVNRSGDTVRVESPTYDFNQTYEVGQPQLPLATKRILNPSGQVVTDFTVTVAKRIIASDVVLPAVEEPKYVGEVSDSPSVFIAANKSLSNAVSLTDGDGRHHGFSYSTWDLAPYLYDADTRELMFVDSVTVSPVRSTAPSETAGSVEIKPRPDLMDWSDMENQAARITYQTADFPNHPLGVTPGSEQIDYVIVTADSLRDAYAPLVKWKRLKGIRTKVVSIDSILELPCEYSRPQEKLKYYLYNLYRNNGLKWCMLGGDNQIVPTQFCSDPRFESEEGKDYLYLPVDFYFCCFEKNFQWDTNQNGIYGEISDKVDYTPEISLTRLPINTYHETSVYVQKAMSYEKYIYPSEHFNKMLFSGAKFYNIESNGQSDAFNLCKKNDTREWLDRTYLFDTYSSIEEEPYVCREAFRRQLNKDNYFVYIATHGADWCYDFGNYSRYQCSDALSQKNIMPSVFLATSCHTAAFDSDVDPCIAEAIIRNPNYGNIAYLGWSRSVSIYNRSMNDFLDAVCNVSPYGGFYSNMYQYAKSKIKTSDGSHLYDFYGLNAFGDATLTFFQRRVDEITWSMHDKKFCVYKDDVDSYGDYLLQVTVIKLDGTNEYSTGWMDMEFIDDREPTFFYYYYDMPDCAFDAMFFSRFAAPLGYFYRPGEVYILENTTIDYSQIIRADSVVIGENVTIIPNKTLTIIAKDNITVKSNVECQNGASLKLKYE